MNYSLLIGNGVFTPSSICRSLFEYSEIIAVDGGANICKQHDIFPSKIIGDLDSCTPNTQEYFRKKSVEIISIPEQNSTDLEKVLYSVDSDIYFCFGFTGGMFDHELSLLHIVQKNKNKKLIFFSEDQIFFCLPPVGTVTIGVQKRISLYPLSKTICAKSSGLQYPLNNLTLKQGELIGTSNKSLSECVSWEIESGCCLGFFPIESAKNILSSLFHVSLD